MIKKFNGISPQIAESAYVSPEACVIGDVVIGERASVFPFAVLRGDEGKIVIGDGSNVQDNVTIHSKTHIGKGVTVGHNAVVHGCTVGDNVLIGMGAIVLDNAIVQKNCLIGAGALVTGGKIIPEGSMAVGTPAKTVRLLSEEEIAGIVKNGEEYVHLGEIYASKEKINE